MDDRLAPLYAILNADGIPYLPATPESGLQVLGNLDLSGTDITELPDHMTVQGYLDISETALARLPDHLSIQSFFNMQQSLVTALPESLSVGTDLWMAESEVVSLPPGLRVPGTLDLNRTAIEVLPEGIDVGQDLDLQYTKVRTLPKVLQVGGIIRPPATLLDFRRFLKVHSDREVLCLYGSQHHRMTLRARLHPFPDLWQVVKSLGTHQQLYLRRETKKIIKVEIQPRRST